MGSIQDVLLQRLTMSDSGGAHLAVYSTNRVTIDQCQFSGYSLNSFLLTGSSTTPGVGRYAGDSLLFFMEDKDISITSNTLSGVPPGPIGDRSAAPMYGFYIKTGNSGF